MVLMVIMSKKMSIFGKAVKPRPMRSFKKVSHNIFGQKMFCEHVSHNRIFSCCLKSLGRYRQNGHFKNVRIFIHKTQTIVVK